jgi:hypothetical protein
MDCVFLLIAHRTSGRGDEVMAPQGTPESDQETSIAAN